MAASYPSAPEPNPACTHALHGDVTGRVCAPVRRVSPTDTSAAHAAELTERSSNMGYGIGGILILILVILAIIYFAKRV
jgi:hypothetical protein